MSNFSENLKLMRIYKGMTQKQVAELVNVPETTFANWEQGKAEPNLLTLAKLSAIFDCFIDDFVENYFSDNGKTVFYRNQKAFYDFKEAYKAEQTNK